MARRCRPAKGQAKVEGDRIVEAAKAEAEQEMQRAKDALRDQVAVLAIAGAEQILRREVNPQVHADLLVTAEGEALAMAELSTDRPSVRRGAVRGRAGLGQAAGRAGSPSSRNWRP